MKKIEIFGDNDMGRLRDKVNRFISDKDVVDIKLTSFTYTDSDVVYAADRVLVVYEEESHDDGN